MMTATKKSSVATPKVVTLLSSLGTMKAPSYPAPTFLIGRIIYIMPPIQTPYGDGLMKTFNLDTKAWGTVGPGGTNYTYSAVSVAQFSGQTMAFFHAGEHQYTSNGSTAFALECRYIKTDGNGLGKPTSPNTTATGHFSMATNTNTNAVYKFGGYPFANYGMEIYDPSTGVWTTGAVAGTSNDRREHGLCYYNGKVYVVGGLNTASAEQASILEYTISTNTWNVLPGSSLLALQMPNPVVLNGAIYVFGGYRSGWHADLLKYDLTTGITTVVTLSLTLPAIAAPCVVTDGTLIYVYEPASGKMWSIAV